MGLMINEKQMWFENYDIDYVSLNKTQSSNKLIFGPPAKTILLWAKKDILEVKITYLHQYWCNQAGN